jgi:nucleoside permease NupC
MIEFLASVFRGIHFMFGITAPPPGKNERNFVLTWLAVIFFFLAFCALLLYLVPHLYFKSESIL